MEEKVTGYINTNHIDTISPSNKYTPQQKHTLNYIIQVLLNNDTERINRWQRYTCCRKSDQTRDLAMTLVLAGTSMQDQYIVDWVYNNGYATTLTTVKLHHKRHLNRCGFNIENTSLYQINEPIYKVLLGPGSDDDEDEDEDEDMDEDEDEDVDEDEDEDNSSLSDVFVGIYVYTSEQDANEHRNPISSTITKVPNNHVSDGDQRSDFKSTERWVPNWRCPNHN